MNNLCRILLVSLLIASPATAREQLRIVGSSTVFPFTAATAEQFSRPGKFRTPIVEINGTGGGFKMFCDGVGDDYPDIANASRPIKQGELDNCKKHGIGSVTELKVGYDGIVIANHKDSAPYKLSKRTIFLALARSVPKDGKLVKNPYTHWSEVDPALPNVPIEVYGPPPAEGTRDAFVEMVMHPACEAIPEFSKEYSDKVIRQQQCSAIREDGKFVELLGGNVMVQKLTNNPDALSVFSYSFLDQNRALVKANPVDGVLPEVKNIVSGEYGVARSLFIYIKEAHLGKVPGLAAFSRFMLSDAAASEDGFLVVKGLIPMNNSERAEMQKRAAALKD